jgi:hypothetical protein
MTSFYANSTTYYIHVHYANFFVFVIMSSLPRDTCFFFWNQVSWWWKWKPDLMMRSVFFFSLKLYCVNFENTVIISVIGVSLSCVIIFLILFHFFVLRSIIFCSTSIILHEALFFNLLYLLAHLSYHESISFKQWWLIWQSTGNVIFPVHKEMHPSAKWQLIVREYNGDFTVINL